MLLLFAGVAIVVLEKYLTKWTFNILDVNCNPNDKSSLVIAHTDFFLGFAGNSVMVFYVIAIVVCLYLFVPGTVVLSVLSQMQPTGCMWLMQIARSRGTIVCGKESKLPRVI